MSQAEAMPRIDRIQTGQSFYYIADFFRAPFGDAPDNGAEFAKLCARLAAGKPAVVELLSDHTIRAKRGWVPAAVSGE